MAFSVLLLGSLMSVSFGQASAQLTKWPDGKGFHPLERQQSQSQSAQLANANVEPTKALSCSAVERQRINSFEGGYIAGGFPRITDDCTKAAVHILSGIDKEKFGTCLMRKLNINASCSHCWWVSGQYGFDNCKLACLGSWCSKRCLKCAAPAVKGIIACAGIPGPAPIQCDGVPGNQTGAEDALTFLAHTIMGNEGASEDEQRLYSVHKNAGIEQAIPTLLLAGVLLSCAAAGAVGLFRQRSRSTSSAFAALTSDEVISPLEQSTRGIQYSGDCETELQLLPELE